MWNTKWGMIHLLEAISLVLVFMGVAMTTVAVVTMRFTQTYWESIQIVSCGYFITALGSILLRNLK